MKTKVLVAGVSVAVLIAGIAIAQVSVHGERKFQRIDTDGDGRISNAESEAFRADRFRKLDADADGFVTKAEMPDRKKRKRSAGLEKRFGKLDADGNGTVEKAEYDAMADSRFERMDSNGDGALTLDEIRDHRQKHHKRHKDG